MIGLGTWICEIDTMFFKGEVDFTIFDNNADYGFDIKVHGVDKLPEFEIKEIKEESENTLAVTATTGLLKGKDITVTLTFEGESVSGVVKVPLLGKIKFSGKKA